MLQIKSLVTDARHTELLSGVLRSEIKLEVAIFAGVRWEVIGPDSDLTPLQALADVPDRLLARAPGWEMIQLSLEFAQSLSAYPFVGSPVRRVTVGAGKIHRAEFAYAESLAAFVGGLCRRAGNIDLHFCPVRKK